jgi:hypothetical protein
LPSPDSGLTSSAALRVAVLVLVVLALQLPINDLPRYGVLLIGSIAIFSSAVRLAPARWFAALRGPCRLVRRALAVAGAAHRGGA